MKKLKPAVDEARAKTWRTALEAAGGNISEAAHVAGINRSYAMRLTKKLDLTEWAAELRKKHGNQARGRPWH